MSALLRAGKFLENRIQGPVGLACINVMAEFTEQDSKVLIEALEKIIKMNRQTAHDKYGDREKAETWSCVTVAREAIHKFRTGE